MKLLISFLLVVLQIVEVKAMFQHLQKKVFSLFHAWNTFRHEPKWAAERESRDGKNNVKGNNGENERNPNAERQEERLRRRRESVEIVNLILSSKSLKNERRPIKFRQRT
jgi:hypothetical protein